MHVFTLSIEEDWVIGRSQVGSPDFRLEGPIEQAAHGGVFA